jgi:hypothetical protein
MASSLRRSLALFRQQGVAVDHSGGNVDQLAVGGARVVAQHLKGSRLVYRVALHEYPLCALGDGATPERALQVVVLGEASQDDVDRALSVLSVGVADVGEDAALGGLLDEVGIGRVDQDDHRTGGLLDDLLDQLQGVLGALAESHERDVGSLPGGHRPDVVDLDLAGDHLMPK